MKRRVADTLGSPLRRSFFAVLLLSTLPGGRLIAKVSPPQTQGADASLPQAALLQPAQLNALLHTSRKPLILQVGSHTLFEEAHIPGAEYAGAAATAAGLATLPTRVTGIPKTAPIVLYCGCCPWDRCPNIRPAYGELRLLGYTDVKVLYLAENFGADWIARGFAVERDQ